MRNLIRQKLVDGEIDMLRASLLSGDAAREAFKAWRPKLDWNNITRSWQRLIPLLERNAIKEGIDDPLIGRFRGLRRYFWLRNLKQMKLAVGIIEELHAAEIPVLALKGLSIVACYFSDRSLRPMEDVDLLVRPEHVALATDILRRLSVNPLNLRHRGVMELEQRREFSGWPFVNGQGDYFDLHWSALQLDRRKRPDEDLWNSAREAEVDGRKVLVMDPADQFIHACAHAVQDESPSALRAAADCAVIATGGLDENRLYRRADYHRLTPAVADMIDVLANDVGLQAALKLQHRKWRPAQRIDLRIAAGPTRAQSPTAIVLRRAALLRRGDDTLFHRSLFRSLWRILSDGRRDLGAPAKQWVFDKLGQPEKMRPLLASDLHRRPRRPEPPPLLSTDIVADGLWAGLGHGWSVDEEPGRWTNADRASLWWQLPPDFRGDVLLTLQRRSVGLPKTPVTVEIRANDLEVGRFTLAELDDLPEKLHVPSKALRNRRLLVVSLTFSKTVRPIDLGLSDDRRALGLLIMSAKASEAHGA